MPLSVVWRHIPASRTEMLRGPSWLTPVGVRALSSDSVIDEMSHGFSSSRSRVLAGEMRQPA
eukprot:9385623-Pyramimonas_sp.AAC.1